MTKLKTRVFAIFISMVLSVSMLSGCNASSAEKPSESSESSETKASESGTEEKDTIVVVVGIEPSKISTYDQNVAASDYINQLTHNGLFKRGRNNEPIPDLIESYEEVSDTEYIMKLKPNVLFHNGMVMTAEDVKATLEYTKTFAENQQYTRSITEIEIIDDLTIKLKTEVPQALLLYDLTHHANYILPKALIDEGNDFNVNPIGTGPYKFVSWDSGDNLKLVAFDDYFDTEGKASIKNIIWKVIPESTSRTIELESGNADVVVDLGTNDIKRLEEADGVSVDVKDGTSYFMMVVNNEVAPFDNVLVRKAINAAIDKQSIVDIAIDGYGKVGLSQTPPIFPESTTENTEEYSKETALALFEESGVDPETIAFDLIVTTDEHKRAAEVIQANLAELGITVSISMMDNATSLQKCFEGDYMAAIGGFTTFSNLSFMNGQLHSNLIGASNRTQLNDPKVDEMLDLANATLDPVKRAEIIEECIVYLNSITTHIPLYQTTIRRAYNSDLDNFFVSSLGLIRFDELKWK